MQILNDVKKNKKIRKDNGKKSQNQKRRKTMERNYSEKREKKRKTIERFN